MKRYVKQSIQATPMSQTAEKHVLKIILISIKIKKQTISLRMNL